MITVSKRKYQENLNDFNVKKISEKKTESNKLYNKNRLLTTCFSMVMGDED